GDAVAGDGGTPGRRDRSTAYRRGRSTGVAPGSGEVCRTSPHRSRARVGRPVAGGGGTGTGRPESARLLPSRPGSPGFNGVTGNESMCDYPPEASNGDC